MGKLSLSDKRIGEIIDEVDALVRIAEDVAMRERLSGQRCTCCNRKLAAPTPSGDGAVTSALCADCAAL